jgi:hypothetical protein
MKNNTLFLRIIKEGPYWQSGIGKIIAGWYFETADDQEMKGRGKSGTVESEAEKNRTCDLL